MNETIDSVLTFWFGAEQDVNAINAEKKALWWSKNQSVDEEIETRFKKLTQAVSNGELDHWRNSAKGLLASIICTDQFPRNMFRGTAKAFSYDGIALGLAQQAVAMGVDSELTPIQRVFVYLPFEHSESMEMQQQAVNLFETLANEVDQDVVTIFDGFVDYAKRHYAVIERFGRFPHRNVILDRESTTEEAEFLTQPGSSF